MRASVVAAVVVAFFLLMSLTHGVLELSLAGWVWVLASAGLAGYADVLRRRRLEAQREAARTTP